MYNILELKEKKIPELKAIGKELGLRGLKDQRKQRLVYLIIDKQAENMSSGASQTKAKGKKIKSDAPKKPIIETIVEPEIQANIENVETETKSTPKRSRRKKEKLEKGTVIQEDKNETSSETEVLAKEQIKETQTKIWDEEIPLQEEILSTDDKFKRRRRRTKVKIDVSSLIKEQGSKTQKNDEKTPLKPEVKKENEIVDKDAKSEVVSPKADLAKNITEKVDAPEETVKEQEVVKVEKTKTKTKSKEKSREKESSSENAKPQKYEKHQRGGDSDFEFGGIVSNSGGFPT